MSNNNEFIFRTNDGDKNSNSKDINVIACLNIKILGYDILILQYFESNLSLIFAYVNVDYKNTCQI